METDIRDENCQHEWEHRESIHPLTGELLATWDRCAKGCRSEKNRKCGKDLHQYAQQMEAIVSEGQ